MPNEYEKRKRKTMISIICSELPLSIEFPNMLEQDSEEYQSLRNGVKKVLGVVVGLLKDRACAEGDSPSKKKTR
ncbi:hypothetical protein RhiirA4_484932 [Rhizophagus irregularis]|uniref:Uncharacterized protein n=1 Tax=Rhizophagus irregularis TaxID=588596 RepID=A0A2I1HPR3_9GLOM|nr:hypothetical protein RhiirA4_484932 [Rhizophagus irregularis]